MTRQDKDAPRGPPEGGGWFWQENVVLDHIPGVGKLAYAVYGVLAKHANEYRRCWPSRDTIAAAVSASTRSVQRAIRTLEIAGLIVTSKRHKLTGGQSSNEYFLPYLPPQDPGDTHVSPGATSVSPPGRHQCLPPLDTSVSPGIRHSVTRPIQQNLLNDSSALEQTESADESSSKTSSLPAEALLDELIDRWNQLTPGIAPRAHKKRSKPIVAGWRRMQRDPEARAHFADIGAVIRAIEEAVFMHGKGCFKLEWLFCQKNSQLNIEKIMGGNYRDNGPSGSGPGRQVGRSHPARPREREFENKSHEPSAESLAAVEGHARKDAEDSEARRPD